MTVTVIDQKTGLERSMSARDANILVKLGRATYQTRAMQAEPVEGESALKIEPTEALPVEQDVSAPAADNEPPEPKLDSESAPPQQGAEAGDKPKRVARKAKSSK